jgi:hypothetical protein
MSKRLFLLWNIFSHNFVTAACMLNKINLLGILKIASCVLNLFYVVSRRNPWNDLMLITTSIFTDEGIVFLIIKDGRLTVFMDRQIDSVYGYSLI